MYETGRRETRGLALRNLGITLGTKSEPEDQRKLRESSFPQGEEEITVLYYTTFRCGLESIGQIDVAVAARLARVYRFR